MRGILTQSLLVLSAIEVHSSLLKKRGWGDFPTDVCDWFDWAGNEAPGAGFEFESRDIEFTSAKCAALDIKETSKLKGKVVADRQDHLLHRWKLTAEAHYKAGNMLAEWIIDGLVCKLHEDSATLASSSLHGDILSWDPLGKALGKPVSIDTSQCDDWITTIPEGGTSHTKDMVVYGHITVPLALSSIYELMVISKTQPGGTSLLLPLGKPGENVVVVTADFFKTRPYGIDGGTVSKDALGFLSYMLSLCKFAPEAPDDDQSPKNLNSFMPRTDLITIWLIVKPEISRWFAQGGNLYILIKNLACWKNDGGMLAERDDEFCSFENPNQPKPNDEMDDFYFPGKDPDDDLDVPILVASIENGVAGQLDALTLHDQQYDRQIGALKDRMEYLVLTDILVPIWELRDLATIGIEYIESFVANSVKSLRYFHREAAILKYPQLIPILRNQARKR